MSKDDATPKRISEHTRITGARATSMKPVLPIKMRPIKPPHRDTMRMKKIFLFTIQQYYHNPL